MHDSLNVFQHHNGVVHHNTNGQHHAEQGQCVNGIAQQVQASKRTQQGHGHSQNWNQRGAPVLQKHIHHDEHQNHRFNQCFHHFANRDFHKTCGVIRHRIVKTFREICRNFIHRAFHGLSHFKRIGTGLQKHTHQCRWLAIDTTGKVVILGSQFHAGNVFQAQGRTIRVHPYQYILELLNILQSALRRDGVDQFLAVVVGRLANFTRCKLCILLVQGRGNVPGGQLQLRHAIRFDPDTHCIIFGTKNLNVGRTRNPLDTVQHVQGHVVRGVKVIEPAVFRVKRQHLQE